MTLEGRCVLLCIIRSHCPLLSSLVLTMEGSGVSRFRDCGGSAMDDLAVLVPHALAAVLIPTLSHLFKASLSRLHGASKLSLKY